MAEYDAKIIEEMADRLYNSARWKIAQWMGGLALVGFTAGFGIGQAMSATSPAGTAMLPMIIAAFLGHGIGKEKTFLIRLEAQQFLLQLQIERNTRFSVERADEIKTILLSRQLS